MGAGGSPRHDAAAAVVVVVLLLAIVLLPTVPRLPCTLAQAEFAQLYLEKAASYFGGTLLSAAFHGWQLAASLGRKGRALGTLFELHVHSLRTTEKMSAPRVALLWLRVSPLVCKPKTTPRVSKLSQR